LLDAALTEHFLDIAGRGVEALPDPVNCQPTIIGFRPQCIDGQPEMLGGILQRDDVAVIGHEPLRADPTSAFMRAKSSYNPLTMCHGRMTRTLLFIPYSCPQEHVILSLTSLTGSQRIHLCQGE
jgi:hypothetical protein